MRIDDEWCSDAQHLRDHVTDYFRQLYMDDRYDPTHHVLNTYHMRLTDLQAYALLAPVSELEVCKALFEMAPLKSPGPDGVHAVFYQEHWDTVRPTLTALVQATFTTSSFPMAINKTNISHSSQKWITLKMCISSAQSH